MARGAAADHVAVAASYRLVFALSLPPLTSRVPSDSSAVPGQNMSCPVSVTVRALTAPVVTSYVAVWVLPVPTPNVSAA